VAGPLHRGAVLIVIKKMTEKLLRQLQETGLEYKCFARYERGIVKCSCGKHIKFRDKSSLDRHLTRVYHLVDKHRNKANCPLLSGSAVSEGPGGAAPLPIVVLENIGASL